MTNSIEQQVFNNLIINTGVDVETIKITHKSGGFIYGTFVRFGKHVENFSARTNTAFTKVMKNSAVIK